MRRCLVKEATTLLKLSGVQRIDSVFFGGGTPSLASPHTVASVLEAVAQTTHLPAKAEVTLEANPTSSQSSRLAAFRGAGINRLSIGIQSLDDTELQLLGRTHSVSEALETLEEARHLYPGRTSVDLIFGLPAQQVEPWLRQLQELLSLCDDHVSLYQLTLERGTLLFAQEAVSTHNWNYWQGGQYIGVGPGAHGRFVPHGDGGILREARIQTLEPDNWMKEVSMFGHGTRKRVSLSKLELLEELLALGLRTDVGITHQHWLQFEPHFSLWNVFGESEEVRELQSQGLLLLDHRGLRCSWEGLAVLDTVLLRLLLQLQNSWENRPSPTLKITKSGAPPKEEIHASGDL
ncbi:radical S-adenosyl methionine domain-containing protein 1, mitochondrial isoform X2 [Macrotis lagotis]|uniref:radical S-adenosyl methionine domain-containing protein 1, mitochondrial isoform X2 n=1 Tax=Macrotis lagotis TaxID=92651 RepID=UPI003D68CFBB